MTARLRSLLLAAPLFLVVGLARLGDAAPDSGKTEPPRTDLAGDPLPPGVVARLGTLRLFQARVDVLAFAPDAKTLAALDHFGTLCLWDVQTGKLLQRFRAPPLDRPPVGAPLAFSPDGKLIALACGDEAVRVWEVASGKQRHTFGHLGERITQVAFDPRGKRLAAGGAEGPIRVWDLERDKLVDRWEGTKEILHLAFTADGGQLTALCEVGDNERLGVVAWDTKTGQTPSTEIPDPVVRKSGTLSPDGSHLLTRDAGGRFCLLEAMTGKLVTYTEGKFDPNGAAVFSGDGKLWTVPCADGRVRIWDKTGGKPRCDFRASAGALEHVALSQDGRLVALTYRRDQAIHIWDVVAGKELHDFGGHRNGPLAVAFSHDGKSVFTTSRERNPHIPVEGWADWSLRQWDPVTGKELRATREDLRGEVHFPCFTADGRRLVTVTDDGTVRVWDTDAGKELLSWKLANHINGAFLTPDGKTFVAQTNGQLRRWNLRTGDELPVLDLPPTPGYIFSCPRIDDDTFVLQHYGDDKRCCLDLLSATSGRVVRSIRIGTQSAVLRTFSPDGKTMVLRVDGGLQLWEVASDRERGDLLKVSDGTAVAFSPDGRLLALGSDDVVRLWHLASGREVGQLTTDPDGVETLVWSADGKRLLVGGYGNTALVCDVLALTAGKLPKAEKLDAEELSDLWDDLRGTDGAKSYRAIYRLAASPAEATPFLKDQLRALEGPDKDEKRIAKLVADLDDNDFEVREAASRALKKMGKKAEPALATAVEKTTSAEVRTRARRLLTIVKDLPQPLTRSVIRLRVLEVLENSGTVEARAVIEALAKSDADTALAQEAKESLRRLGTRKPPGR